LLDNNLSWRLVALLAQHGMDAMHVRDFGLASASDEEVLAAALNHRRVLVSQDGDFPRMMAAAVSRSPSIVLLRAQADDRPEYQAMLLVAAVREHEEALARGCILVVEDHGVRVRHLPLGD
jgi:predicted nuclease of predicted toxin-antitoxin system